jgi:hypothetical protein
MTDYLMEFMKTKMVETNNNIDDGVILLMYRIILAFTRKKWKLHPSIGCYVQIWSITEARLTTIHRTTHAHTEHKIVHTLPAWKQRLHAYTRQCTESYMNIYLCIFLLQIIFHKEIVTETEEVGSVMEGTLYAVD